MKPTKEHKAGLATIRQDVTKDLKEIYDMSEIVDLLRELIRNPDLALDRFYEYRDRRDCYVRLLRERVQNLMKQKLLSKSFGRTILYELEQLH